MISIDASFNWNNKTKKALQNAPEKTIRLIARQTLDFTVDSKFVPSSEGAPYRIPANHRSGELERSTSGGGVKGDYATGIYIGSFTDYAQYVYGRQGVHWTRGSTKPKWFEYTWEKYGKGILANACKVNKL